MRKFSLEAPIIFPRDSVLRLSSSALSSDSLCLKELKSDCILHVWATIFAIESEDLPS